MKPFFIEALALGAALFFSPVVLAEETSAPSAPVPSAASSPSPRVAAASSLPEGEKEYYDAVVLLVDHKESLLGVSHVDEATGKEEKLSFRIDPQDVNVTNTVNHALEFADIQVGDRLDLYSAVDAQGHEKVYEIIEYNRFEEE